MNVCCPELKFSYLRQVSEFVNMDPTTPCNYRDPWNGLAVSCLNNSIGFKPVFVGAHCHAPACLSQELYNADTGDLICR